ncbi:MAG: pilus assembly protein PilM [Candidatus Omnitrophica bacterium]|nr:pilus assembly protein PilM [Candidatus Omnitrophota bacterium]
MSRKSRKTLFICQFTDKILKVVKCVSVSGQRKLFVACEALEADQKGIAEALRRVLLKLGYNNDQIIISLPRIQSTCRYLRVPAQQPAEIEGIVSLQASHYLPYPAGELVTGYQLISTDTQGYSYINLVITHKDVVERNLDLFKGFKERNISIILSSYGLSRLYNLLHPKEARPVMIMDIDQEWVELAIVLGEKVLFSRSFRLSDREDWGILFINEIKKTQDAYLKDVSKEPPVKIVITGVQSTALRCVELLKEKVRVDVEILDLRNKIKFSNSLLDRISKSDNSFVSLIGLGLLGKPESLNLIPLEIKEQARKTGQRKESMKLILSILGIIFVLSLAVFKNLDNKSGYLRQLVTELDKIESQAKPLEDMENRLNLIERQSQEPSLSLEVLHELYRVLPNMISLNNFIYEEDKQVTLRGQSPQMNSIFDFISRLEQSLVFSNFEVKVKYATQKKASMEEFVNFEIVCLKK